MIPRPIFKILAVVLWPTLSLGLFWAWWHWADEPKTYYLGWRSKFLYERLVLPSLPALPGRHTEPEHSTLLGYRCGRGYCLATPGSIASGKPVENFVQFAPSSLVKQELDQQVYGGGLTAAFWLPIFGSIALFVTMLPGSIYFDYKRRKRILKGVQIQGRWPVRAEDFAGFFAKVQKSTVQIDVERPDGKAAPLG